MVIKHIKVSCSEQVRLSNHRERFFFNSTHKSVLITPVVNLLQLLCAESGKQDNDRIIYSTGTQQGIMTDETLPTICVIVTVLLYHTCLCSPASPKKAGRVTIEHKRAKEG